MTRVLDGPRPHRAATVRRTWMYAVWQRPHASGGLIIMALLLIIERKCKEVPIRIASPDDFSYSREGPIDPQLVLQNPNISLYCLDHARWQAIFVETDDG